MGRERARETEREVRTRERDRQADRDREGQTDRQTDRQKKGKLIRITIDNQTGRHTEIQFRKDIAERRYRQRRRREGRYKSSIEWHSGDRFVVRSLEPMFWYYFEGHIGHHFYISCLGLDLFFIR